MIYHAAAIIVINRNGKVLMQHRENKPIIFYPDHWVYPGGMVQENEDFELAAKRELKEETNYTPDITFPLTEEDYTRTDGKTVRRHIFWTVYDDKQEIQCNEGLEMKFLGLEELKEKKLVPGQERLLLLAVKNAKAKNLI